MKCLLVADLHYSLKQLDWLLGAARGMDLVIVAGDHLDISAHVNGPVQIAVVNKYFRRLAARAKAVVCSGNHDLDATNDAGEKYARWLQAIRPLGIATDGDTFTLNDTLFTVCPWWDGPRTRDAVDRQLARDASTRQGRWIWIYHSPPQASPTSQSGGGRDFGDPDLSGWIATYAPDMVLAGHVHDAPFRNGGSWVDRIGSTWVFNAGRQIGPQPTCIVFDLDEDWAYWLSAERAETVRLDAPLTRPVPPLLDAPEWLTSLGLALDSNPA
jgi:Icc-related predicted phosphoesterase